MEINVRLKKNFVTQNILNIDFPTINLNGTINIKDDLNHLYKISNYREFSICAANNRTIEKIEKELSDKGFVLNE